MSVFEWPNSDWLENCDKKQYFSMPGQIYDRMDNDARSHVAEGGPLGYGRVAVRGQSSNQPGFDGHMFTKYDSASMPDAKGLHLKNKSGVTYAEAGLALPRCAETDELITLGIVIMCECCPSVRTLAEPWGFGDCYYVDECKMAPIATEGNITAFAETDINVTDKLYYRTCITAPGQILGAFLNNDDGGNAQRFRMGTVFEPGPAGGGFVVHLNSSNV